jgi:hypothetical protein
MVLSPARIGVITPYDGQRKYVSDCMRRAVATTTNQNGSKNMSINMNMNIRNGSSNGQQDWDGLTKIAEGNPNPNKIGAFVVMFSICEEPIIISDQQCSMFCWDRDALYTNQIPMTNNNNNNNNNNNKATEPPTPDWTTFLLPSRDIYPLSPHYITEMGQFPSPL